MFPSETYENKFLLPIIVILNNWKPNNNKNPINKFNPFQDLKKKKKKKTEENYLEFKPGNRIQNMPVEELVPED